MISHYEIDSKLSNIDILNILDHHKLYHEWGVFKNIYRYPFEYLTDGCCISVLYKDEKTPISTIILPKNQYFGYERYYPKLKNTYGLIGFYTNSAYRMMGHSAKLFSEFDKHFKIDNFAAHYKAPGFIKSIPNIMIVE